MQVPVTLDFRGARWLHALMPSPAFRDDAGRTLNATVELEPRGVVLHSRSGTERNRDYRQALETVLGRLDRAGLTYAIFLDSQPVQGLPLEQRRLTFERKASIKARFDQLVQSMNAGSASRGAWRRILITVTGVSSEKLRAVLYGQATAPTVERLPAALLRQVTSEHIQKAVAKLLAGAEAPNFAPSRDYDALTDGGTPLAPKKIFGLALEDALGLEAFPGHFSAGWGQVCFELLEEAGLWIVPKSGSVARPKVQPAEVEANAAKLNPTEEERSWIEGNPRIVSHLKREREPGLAKHKRAEFVAKHGRLFCEECHLDPVSMYGSEAGPACIEVHHHRVHVAAMEPGHVTVTDDLQCLCASCHRVLHRKLSLGIGPGVEPHEAASAS